jgi:uncharacterized OsmC-like protein
MAGSTIADALDRLSNAIEADPARARAKHSSATANLVEGLKCLVSGPSGELIETDMPRAMGGSASHPSPGWYFRASLAACCATVIAQQAARRGIGLTELEVTVESSGDNRGLLGLDPSISAGHSLIRTSVRIGAQNASKEQLQDLVRWANDHSPVACTIRDAPTNELHVT